MKKVLVAAMCAAVMGWAGSAMASLPTLTGTYEWNSADYWSVTDLSKGQGAFKLEWENSNASFESSFGLYSFDNSAITHEIFAYALEPVGLPSTGQTASVWFKYEGGVWKISGSENGAYSAFGNIFGFYADVYTPAAIAGGGVVIDNIADYRWYTDISLNTDNKEHFFVAYDGINHDSAIYLEDLPGGNVGNDSVDLMVTSSDLTPVPEPTTMLLFGTGLAGLAAVGRRRMRK